MVRRMASRVLGFTVWTPISICASPGYTPCRPLTDLSAIPFLYDDLAPFENRILYYETSRGCPFRCSYCLDFHLRQPRAEAAQQLYLLLPQDVRGNLEVEICDTIVMFQEIGPDRHGVGMAAVEGAVYEFYLPDPVPAPGPDSRAPL